MNDTDDELLDLVDENDMVVGTINRADYHKLVNESLGYIRAAELFIVNDKGQVWTPVRTADKTIAPNGYDYSASGHVGAGETYLQALIRETKEEINLDISENELVFMAKIKSDDIRYFRSLYMLRSNVAPEFNPNDFVSAAWLQPDELIASIANGHPAKQSLRASVAMLVDYLANR